MNDSYSMVCIAPEVTNLKSTVLSATEPHPLSFGFLLDDVTALLNWTRDSDETFDIYADPEFEPFLGDVKSFRLDNDYLTINVSLVFISINPSFYVLPSIEGRL